MSLSPERKQELEEKLKGFVGIDGGSFVASDLVNEAMVRHFCAAVGDENPAYQDPNFAKDSLHEGIVAPPAMLNAWTMPAFIPPWADESGPAPNKEVELHRLLGSYGYTGVVATNHDMDFERYLRPGDHVSATLVVDSISEEKATPLGVGYFLETAWTFRDQHGEKLGALRFRTLRYRPAQEPQVAGEAGPTAGSPTRLRPPMGHDNAWWWEGIDAGHLLIQCCKSCGALRHPPRPMCGECQSLDWEGQPASGAGEVYSFTILHHPQVPGYDYPLICALIELEEGTRLVANVVDCEPEALHIGMPVQASIENVDDALKLPVFRPAR